MICPAQNVDDILDSYCIAAGGVKEERLLSSIMPDEVVRLPSPSDRRSQSEEDIMEVQRHNLPARGHEEGQETAVDLRKSEPEIDIRELQIDNSPSLSGRELSLMV